MKFEKNELQVNVLIEQITINLSYKDLASFLDAYSNGIQNFNKGMSFKDEYLKNSIVNGKKVENDTDNKNKIKNIFNNLINKNNEEFLFKGEFNFKPMNITLIDDSFGSFHPFINFGIEYITMRIDEDKKSKVDLSWKLLSYNYIACVWEPMIEKNNIVMEYVIKNVSKDKINNTLNINMDKLLINLSDMALSFSLLTFNNWLTK